MKLSDISAAQPTDIEPHCAGARPNLLSCADLLMRIKTSDVAPATKLIWQRAIKKACAWFGLPPEHTLAHSRAINTRFRALSPGGLGMKKKRISNVKSEVAAALTWAGLVGAPSYLVSLTQQWKRLVDIARGLYPRARLSRMAHYCSARGIEPPDVTDAVAKNFFDALLNERLVQKPQRAYRDAIKEFNRVALDTAGLTQLTVPYFNDRYVLEPERFAGTLRDAISAFVMNSDVDDPFDTAGRDRPIRPVTSDQYCNHLYRVASLMVLAGRPVEELTGLDRLVEIAWVKAAFKYLLNRREYKPRALIGVLSEILAQVSKGYVVWSSDVERKENLEHLNKLAKKFRS